MNQIKWNVREAGRALLLRRKGISRLQLVSRRPLWHIYQSPESAQYTHARIPTTYDTWRTKVPPKDQIHLPSTSLTWLHMTDLLVPHTAQHHYNNKNFYLFSHPDVFFPMAFTLWTFKTRQQPISFTKHKQAEANQACSNGCLCILPASHLSVL